MSAFNDLCKQCGEYKVLRHYTEQYGLVCEECYRGRYAVDPNQRVTVTTSDGTTIGNAQFVMERCTECGEQAFGRYDHGIDKLCHECHWERLGGKPPAKAMAVSYFIENIVRSIRSVSYMRYTDYDDDLPHPGDEVWIGQERYVLIED